MTVEAQPFKRFQVRDRANFVTYVGTELVLLKKEWKILLPCVIMQYVHGIFHNIAYWIQGHKLSVEQRYPLHDLGFSIMSELHGTASHLSEYFVFGLVFAPAIILVLTIPLFRPNPNKPRYMVIVLKRVLFHISVALAFRIISFLVTTLPSPAEHCRLNFDQACLKQNPGDSIKCVIPNPDFKPPTTSEFFTNMDALNGCGDLMFSSHTIYTLSLILTVSKYWWNKWLFAVMICVQIAIAFLIVASRKHYTLDVFSALYIVPLLWFTHEAYFKDINHKDVEINAESIHRFYGIDISEELNLPAPVAVQGVDTELGEPKTPDTGSSNAPFERKNSM